MKYFLTVQQKTEYLLVVERSKFICTVISAKTEDECKAFIDDVKKRNPFANHNCFAYVLGENVQKFSDDGEPQGTAGLPILEMLKSNSLTNVCAVVTRYFGGIKLGVGGLSRAYSKAVKGALESCKVIKFVLSNVYKIFLEYENYSKILPLFNDGKVKVINSAFNNGVEIVFAVDCDYDKIFMEKLNNFLCGKLNVEFVNKDFINL